MTNKSAAEKAIFSPLYEPYDPTDKKGFSYETVLHRWPTIITKLVDTVYEVNHELVMTLSAAEESGNRTGYNAAGVTEKIDEGKAIIEKAGLLKYEMARDKVMQPLEDGEPDVKVYNKELKVLATRGKNTWFTCPWLYAECYLYRLLRSYFYSTKHWKTYDPFSHGKENSFKASSAAVYKLAEMMYELEETKAEFESHPEKLLILFNEMVQMCLWGNATDLSLLTNLTHEDILKLQNIEKEAQEARKDYILRDDTKDTFEHLKTLRDAQVDFVLDNAGFELFTDLIFADFLVTYTPYVSRVVFHPKRIPWFVSDVIPSDFSALLAALHGENFFSAPAPSASAASALGLLVRRWNAHISAGAFSMSVPLETQLGEANPTYNVWTGPHPYWSLRTDSPEVFNALSSSGLVIFKGDLNYRKLTGDIRWPASTPFEEAIGPLAGAFPILSLRTSKADVVVGISAERAAALDASGESWRVNGKYAMISFAPRRSSQK